MHHISAKSCTWKFSFQPFSTDLSFSPLISDLWIFRALDQRIWVLCH